MGRRIESHSFDEDTGRAMLTRQNVITKARYTIVKCKFCGEWEKIVQYGHTSKQIQRYLCQKCGRTFLDNKAPERMQYPIEVIASAVNRYYESGSYHQIKRQLALDFGKMIDHSTIYLWVVKYTMIADKLLSNIPVEVGDVWVADETMIDLKSGGGEKIWVWDAICDTTKFLLACHLSEGRTTQDALALMEKAERQAGRFPKVIITDKLRSYLDAVERAWGSDSHHLQSGPFVQGRGSTRAVERLHGTLKDRSKIMRALANKSSARLIISGWRIHYNFFRPHMGLGGKTPAQVAGAMASFKSWADIVRYRG